MSKKHHFSQIEFIDKIIYTEYEILSCINACNAAQKRAMRLMDKIKNCNVIPNAVLNNLNHSINPLLKNPNKQNIIILPLLTSTLHSIRVRLERDLNQKELLNTMHSSPKQRKHSNLIKEAIQTRAFNEKLHFLQNALKQRHSEQKKVDTMITSYAESKKSIIKDENNDALNVLLEERMKNEMEINLLLKNIEKTKKRIADHYGSEDGKKEYENNSDDYCISDANQTLLNAVQKKSICVQTCSAFTGFKKDQISQTKISSYKTATLSTQTNGMLFIENDSNQSNLQTIKQLNDKQNEDGKKAKYTESRWFRRDLQLPVFMGTYSNELIFNANPNSTQKRTQKKKAYQRNTKKSISRKTFAESFELHRKRFVTRWHFSIDDRWHWIEIKYTDVMKDRPQIILDSVCINFEKSYKTYRIVRDGKYWRVLLKIYSSNLSIRSMDGKTYKLFINGEPFEELKKTVLQKQWN